MNSDLLLDENFLDEEEILRYSNIFNDQSVPWYFLESTVLKSYEQKDPTVFFDTQTMFDWFMFGHLAYGDMQQYSMLFNPMQEIFNKFCKKNNIFYRSIIRAKVNLVTKSNIDKCQPAHVDFNFDHNVFLYYVDNSDGDTIIYNETYSGRQMSTVTEKNRISPKAGRAVNFNGLNFHSPTPPLNNNKRITINIVYV